jgi:two-component system alkaline phosphatase synthesis response regulator PhoP
VLVIDDDPDILLLCRLNLGYAGMEVLEARGGEEGIAASLVELPDVIVLDLMMPQVDGIEVLRRLKAEPRTSTIPVVVITAKALGDDQDLTRALGADIVLMKPFTMRELTTRVLTVARSRSQ